MNYDYKNLPPFKWFILENFPFIEADFDALTNWQLFCKLGKEMNKIIENLNLTGEQVENLTNAFNELKSYVDNYFENLDVQEEINNKLDEMAESGTLEEIISSYLNTKALLVFDNVSALKSAENLKNGSYVKTLGYYNIADGGESIYKVRTVTNDDVIDEKLIIELLDNTLIAELIINNQTINIKQFGAKGDGITNDADIINYALNTVSYTKIKKVYFNEKYFIGNTTIIIGNNKDIEGIKTNLQYDNNVEPEFITDSNITVLNLSTHTNISIKNINIVHPAENTVDIINASRCRYINIENMQVYHSGNNVSNCIVYNDTVDNSSFAGYITINNLRCLKYQTGIKSRATFIKIKNCVINNCSSYAIWLTQEGIGGISECDITGTGTAIRYDGEYSLNLQNNYFEGYYMDRFLENTNNVRVNMEGCKIYISQENNNRTKKYISDNLEFMPDNFKFVKNSFDRGYPSLQNLTINGNFKNGTRGWTITPNQIFEKNKSEMGIKGLPPMFDKCLQIGTAEVTGYSTLRQAIYKSISKDNYITFGAWVYMDTLPNSYPHFELEGYNGSSWENIINVRSNAQIFGKWLFISATSITPNDYEQLRITISTNNRDIFYITGVSLNLGLNANMDCTLTPNEEKVLTNNLIIKGTDDKFYKIKCDGSNLSFEEVTNINL